MRKFSWFFLFFLILCGCSTKEKTEIETVQKEVLLRVVFEDTESLKSFESDFVRAYQNKIEISEIVFDYGYVFLGVDPRLVDYREQLSRQSSKRATLLKGIKSVTFWTSKKYYESYFGDAERLDNIVYEEKPSDTIGHSFATEWLPPYGSLKDTIFLGFGFDSTNNLSKYNYLLVNINTDKNFKEVYRGWWMTNLPLAGLIPDLTGNFPDRVTFRISTEGLSANKKNGYLLFIPTNESVEIGRLIVTFEAVSGGRCLIKEDKCVYTKEYTDFSVETSRFNGSEKLSTKWSF
jgi:hypothetical protein